MTPLERKLFAEYWHLTHKKSSASTEDNNAQPNPILPQTEADEYERDENQLVLEI